MLPTIQNQDLLMTALTHRSALNESDSGTTSKQSNERLEFLGDAVLELITTEYLFNKFPRKPEGELTVFRSALVKTETLAELASELGLGNKLYMSHGEENSGGRNNQSLLANSMEAYIGALYLDQGLKVVTNFLQKSLFVKLKKIMEKKLYKDAKSQLQEIVQAKGLSAPIYETVKAEGPDHDKRFQVQVIVEKQVQAIGIGKSKQLAQQNSAKKALQNYKKDGT